MNYQEFIDSKQLILESSGFEVDRATINQNCFEFQKDIVRWALAKGRACIFADCGLGKTLMQLEWARQIVDHEGKDTKVLIVAPLAVCEQTKNEGIKFGIESKVVASDDEVEPGINITNYEKIHNFDTSVFTGVVLDESSILKSFTGAIRNQLIDAFAHTKYRLACTATPAPNDYMELGNHSEFVGIMTRSEMLSMYFVHDGGDTSKWRLKKHAVSAFWEWMASWAVFVVNPKDLGYDGSDYVLPDLQVEQVIVDGKNPVFDKLTLTERRKARNDSLEDRCKKASEMINGSDEQWVVWCGLNKESELLGDLINGSKEIKGSDKDKYRADTMNAFINGDLKCLITKPSIAGFGINMQNCHNMIFVGLSDSFEQYYQALRRCWRFGQKHDVKAYIVISSKEGTVLENINRKQSEAMIMQKAMVELTKDITSKELRKTCKMTTEYKPHTSMILPKWEEMIYAI